jgi:prepilin-type N-terminal cleavage/methylation domain-containing protein
MPKKKQNQQAKSGFTIIEVVLVLAIAGLIFLMVFVALPALQRSQRDTQRRNDMSRVDTALVQYQTNHTTGSNITSLPDAGSWVGAENFPTTCNSACAFIQQYMNSGSGTVATNDFTDPDGTYYSMVITDNWSIAANQKSTTNLGVTIGSTTYNSQLAVTEKSGVKTGTITGQGAYDAHVIYVVPGGQCDGADVVPSSAKHFAILYRLEGAGVYCMDDQ